LIDLSLVQGGKSSFTGFTKLCKGLAVILFLAHTLVQLFPSTAGYLALIPARYTLDSRTPPG
jgi:hypothetical protein